MPPALVGYCLDGLNDLKAFPDLGPPGDARGVRQADLTHLEEVVEVFALEASCDG